MTSPVTSRSRAEQVSLILNAELIAKVATTGSSERPQVCWPQALRAVRGWLEPWMLLQRYWRAWSKAPPPLALQHLLDWLGQGNALFPYELP